MLDVKCTCEHLYVVDRMDMRRDAALQNVVVGLGLVYIHWAFSQATKEQHLLHPATVSSKHNQYL